MAANNSRSSTLVAPERGALSSQRFPQTPRATLMGTDRATRPSLSRLLWPRGVDLLAGFAQSPAWGLTQVEPVGPKRGRQPPQDRAFTATRRGEGQVEQANNKVLYNTINLCSKFLGKCQDIGEIIYLKKRNV